LKELLAAFAAEIFRPVVTLLIPGFWALTPWTISMFLHYPMTWDFVSRHHEGGGLVFVVFATAVGMILENLGSRLEICYDRRCAKGSSENWYAYLALAVDPEPIGLRYIRTIVLRMKFELAMCSAGPIALIGIVCIPVNVRFKIAAFCIALVLTLYFQFESSESVRQLEKTRIEMLHRLSNANPNKNADVPG
jgi:hypothetical protein